MNGRASFGSTLLVEQRGSDDGTLVPGPASAAGAGGRGGQFGPRGGAALRGERLGRGQAGATGARDRQHSPGADRRPSQALAGGA